MSDVEAWTNKIQAVRGRAWELTEPVLNAFTSDGVDEDAYAHAAGAAAAEVGLAHMMWAWAGMLWPTSTPPELAEQWGIPLGQPWVDATGQLLDAAARYAIDPVLPHLSNTLHVAESVLRSACADLDELWSCAFFWARALYRATEAAGGLEQVGAVDRWHWQWAAVGRGRTLSTPLALVVSTIAAGDIERANSYLATMAAMKVDLAEITATWIIGLSQMVTSLDYVALVDSDGTVQSMGRITEIPESADPELRMLATLTHDLVTGVQRGDAEVFTATRARTGALGQESFFRWSWMLARLVGGAVAQLRAHRDNA